MHSLFVELSVVIGIATGVAFTMRLIRQPLIIGYIITGILVGPVVLKLVQQPQTFEAFSNIGIALLLFIIGLGLNPQVVREVGKVVAITASVQMFLTIVFAYVTARFFHYSKTESIIYGAGVAFTSTIIILKLLSDKKELQRLYGKITVGITLLQDVFATVALLLVASKASDQSITLGPFLYLAAKGLLVVIPMYFITAWILPRAQKFIAGSQEFLFLFAIGWGFGAAAIFESIGFSLEVGALFAGICLAPLAYAQEISARLRPLRDFFLIVFFITLGSGLQFSSIGGIMPLIIFGVIISIFIKPLISMITLGLLGYTKRTSFKVSMSLSQVSEFSLVLVVLAVRRNIIGPEMLTAMTVIALVSIAISAYFITYADNIYSVLEKRLSLFERRKTRYEQESTANYEMVLFGYQKGGHEFLRLFQQLKKSFVVIDYDPDMIDILEKQKVRYLYGDATDIELLQEARLEKAKLIVSVMTDYETTNFVVNYISNINKRAVIICHADNAENASKLYKQGASYVMMPHYIGSEKISAFIKRSGLRKSEFKKFREKHLQYLEDNYALNDEDDPHNQKLGHAVLHHVVGETNSK